MPGVLLTQLRSSLISVQEIDPNDFKWGQARLLFDMEGTPYTAGNSPRTYIQRYEVVLKKGVPVDKYGPVAISQVPKIPKPGQLYGINNPYEVDQLAVVTDIHVKTEPGTDALKWIVTVTFSTQVAEGGYDDTTKSPNRFPFGSQNDPTQEPPHVRWETEIEQVSRQRDLDNKPYLNSCKQPFTPAPQFPTAYPVLIITRNEAEWGASDQLKFSFAVNQTMFLGHPPETWQSYPPIPNLMSRGRLNYYRVSYRLRLKTETYKNSGGQDVRETWQPQLLDQGMYQLKTLPIVGTVPIPIFRNNLPISQPVALDGKGQPAKITVSGDTASITPVFLPFRNFRKLEFNDVFISDVTSLIKQT